MKKISEIFRKSYPWWDDCYNDVTSRLSQDLNTSHENLREKAMNYVKNYIAFNAPEISQEEKKTVANEIADKVETVLKNSFWSKEPPASKLAREKRNSIWNQPENKFIKLRKT